MDINLDYKTLGAKHRDDMTKKVEETIGVIIANIEQIVEEAKSPKALLAQLGVISDAVEGIYEGTFSAETLTGTASTTPVAAIGSGSAGTSIDIKGMERNAKVQKLAELMGQDIDPMLDNLVLKFSKFEDLPADEVKSRLADVDAAIDGEITTLQRDLKSKESRLASANRQLAEFSDLIEVMDKRKLTPAQRGLTIDLAKNYARGEFEIDEAKAMPKEIIRGGTTINPGDMPYKDAFGDVIRHTRSSRLAPVSRSREGTYTFKYSELSPATKKRFQEVWEQLEAE